MAGLSRMTKCWLVSRPQCHSAAKIAKCLHHSSLLMSNFVAPLPEQGLRDALDEQAAIDLSALGFVVRDGACGSVSFLCPTLPPL